MPHSSDTHYAYRIHALLVPFLRILLGVRSSPSRDARTLLQGQPAPRILSAENIPPTGPFILVMNHYDRPGLGTWWGAAALLCAIAEHRTGEPRDCHIAMASEWWYPPGLGRLIKQPLTQWFFGQMAKTYELIRLPPVIENDERRGQGMLAVRHALAMARRDPAALFAIAPEGHTGPNQSLVEPPRGAGLFLQMLSRNEIPFLPAGIYEQEEGGLTGKFGRPFEMSRTNSGSRDERDRHAAKQVMVEIGKLLPEEMHGAYRVEIVRQTVGEATPE